MDGWIDMNWWMCRICIEHISHVCSVCFATPVQTLAMGCVDLLVNATLMGAKTSLQFNGCFNKEMVPKMAHFIANTMFPNIHNAERSRSVLSKEKPHEEADDITTSVPNYAHHVTKRVRRHFDEKQQIEPFWDMLPNYDPLGATLKSTNHQSKVSLKRTWKIPGSFTVESC